jgi:hypothetical protein
VVYNLLCLRGFHRLFARSFLRKRRGGWSRLAGFWRGRCRDDLVQESWKETLYSIVSRRPKEFLLVGPRIWGNGWSQETG